jgi:histidine triad (HIT) family protein
MPVRVRLSAPVQLGIKTQLLWIKRLFMQQGCVFCAIITGSIPAHVIERTSTVVAIEDIAPKAPIHYLIIPIKHIPDIVSLTQEDCVLVGDMLIMAKMLAQSLSGSKAFRLVSNNGHEAGQSVFHMHMHFLSGATMNDLA